MGIEEIKLLKEINSKVIECDTGGIAVTDVTITQISGTISVNNSTSTPLGSDGVFTGVAEDVSNYKSIGIIAKASHISATNGLTMQFSNDGTNWDLIHSFTLPAITGKFFNLPVEAKYFRLIYTNSSVIQTYFRLQTIYHATTTKESTLRVSEDVDGETAAQLGRSIIAGKKPSGAYTNIQATVAGNLKVCIEEQDPGAGLATESGNLATIATNTGLATTPTIYNVTMTNADTEYSQALPAGTKILEFRCLDPGFATRYAYATGKVATPTAPYGYLGAGEVKTVEGLNLSSKTLYFACASAGKIMEIECWT